MSKRNPLQHSKTPLCDALMRNRLNSNDLGAWRDLAYKLEKIVTKQEGEIVELQDQNLYGIKD